MIHIYCGDGKGKSTAAAGLALRAAGNGLRVMFVQFLKTESNGERAGLQTFENITLPSCPLELRAAAEMDEHERRQAGVIFRGMFDRAAEATLSERYDMIVLDEVFDVIVEGMLGESDVFAFISNAPNNIEIVMTGHDPSDRFLAAADYITEFKSVRHPSDRGVPARIGIEF